MVHEDRNGQAVAVHAADRLHDALHHLDRLGTAFQRGVLRSIFGIRPAGGHVNLDERRGARVDSAMVHVDDVLAFLR